MQVICEKVNQKIDPSKNKRKIYQTIEIQIILFIKFKFSI